MQPLSAVFPHLSLGRSLIKRPSVASPLCPLRTIFCYPAPPLPSPFIFCSPPLFTPGVYQSNLQMISPPIRPLWSRKAKNPDISTGSLACPSARLHALYHSLVSLLRTACFTRALRCAHFFACSLPRLCGGELLNDYFCCVFFLFWAIVHLILHPLKRR